MHLITLRDIYFFNLTLIICTFCKAFAMIIIIISKLTSYN